MIVLVWELFLASPQFITVSTRQAVLYSSTVMAFILPGHSQDGTVQDLTYRTVCDASKRPIWQRLYLPSYSNVSIKRSGSGRKRLTSYRKKYPKTVKLYRKLPLTVMSRAWGWVCRIHLPQMFRRPLLGLYVWMWSVDLDEAADDNLDNYRNLSEFFRRQLKPHVRPVHEEYSLTSPCDGRLMYFGVVETGRLEQVKGVTYSLQDFLGPMSWKETSEDNMLDQEYSDCLKTHADHQLYHCVIYLAPGDYHRFHSAADWTVRYRRHFPGDLLSVSPHVARLVAGLYNYNERAMYTGEWEYGFFSYTAVGATGVGSIKIYCDQDLQTNIRKHKHKKYLDKNLCAHGKPGLPIQKGDMFGEFNFGSTIVLVFEAPKHFKFSVENGQKMKFGQPIGSCRPG